MSEYGLAVSIFLIGAATSLLLVRFIMVNSSRCRRESQLSQGRPE